MLNKSLENELLPKKIEESKPALWLACQYGDIFPRLLISIVLAFSPRFLQGLFPQPLVCLCVDGPNGPP